VSYGLGINLEYASIVATVSAASPVVTIVLARFFMGERLELNPKVGVVAVLVAHVLIFL